MGARISAVVPLLFLLVAPIFVTALTPVSAATDPSVPTTGPFAYSPSVWDGPDGPYGSNTNYSPQTALSVSNVGSLQSNWMWPVPENEESADQGIASSAIIENGVVYLISQSQRAYAIDARESSLIWAQTFTVNYNKTLNVQDVNAGLPNELQGAPTGHYHDGSWAYTTDIYGQSLIWIDLDNYTMYAYNSLSGAEVTSFSFYNAPSQIPGNFGYYANLSPMFVIDQFNQVLLVGLGTGDANDGGRGAFLLYSTKTNPPTFEKYIFIMPPQDASDPSWSYDSVQNMSYAWIFNGTAAVNLKTLPSSTLHTLLDNDWGAITDKMGYNGSLAGVQAGDGFGGPWAFDPDTHMMYVSTSNPSPDMNATFRPGPDLWSDSVLAINENTGNIVWAFQGVPHDLDDSDCGWNVVLANITYAGSQHEAVIKGCKSGYIFALDAKTGQLLWDFNPPTAAVTRGQYNIALNPLSQSEMSKPWMNYPSTSPFIANPTLTGALESNIAFDPTKNLVFAAEMNNPALTVATDVPPTTPLTIATVPGLCPTTTCVYNMTLFAIDAATGKPVWETEIPSLAFRGGISVTNGLVILPGLDGYIRFFNEQNGQLVRALDAGGPASAQPAIGQDLAGNTILVFPIGISEEFSGFTPLGEVPGYVVSYGLPAASVTTTTVSSGPATSSILFYAILVVVVVLLVATVVLALRQRGPSRTGGNPRGRLQSASI